ncbi:MAG: hypothetical protein ACRDNJ_16675, partial [Solirubrobacteraceae bacterium]
MLVYVLKRLGLALITLWILSLIVFFAAQVLPGDPARSILGPLAAPSAVAALSHQLGTDRSVIAQYTAAVDLQSQKTLAGKIETL